MSSSVQPIGGEDLVGSGLHPARPWASFMFVTPRKTKGHHAFILGRPQALVRG